MTTIPNNSDMEQALLGCILLDNDGSVLPAIVSEHSCIRDYFHDVRCRIIFNNMLNLFDSNKKIELMFLMNEIKKNEGMEEAGGVLFVTHLTDKSPSSYNWKSYAKELMGYYIKRRLLTICNDTVARVSQEPEAERALDRVQKEILAVAQEHSKAGEKDTTALAAEYCAKLAASVNDPHAMTGILTKYNSLDNVLGGFKPAEIIILAARPSVGKTSFALCVAREVAVNQKRPVGIFSLEMSASALVARLIHMQAEIGRDKALGHLTQINEAASQISSAPFHIDDRSGLSVQQITAAARRMVHQHRIELLVIDYLQLIRSTRDRGSRNDEVTEISNGCKSLAKELNIPIILLSQLSRSADKDMRPPKLSDLRDSGSLEQDCDVCCMLWRDPEYVVNDEDKVLPVKLSVDKNRDGMSGVKIDFLFMRNLTRFKEAKIYA
jgi:replicative DNA helicase